MLVPNVIGTTVGEARSMIEGAGLSVGNVTVTQRRAMLEGFIRVAWALDEMIVIAQHPTPARWSPQLIRRRSISKPKRRPSLFRSRRACSCSRRASP